MKRIAMTLLAVLMLGGLLSGCIATQAAEAETAAPTAAEETTAATEATENIIDITVETFPPILSPQIPIETIPPRGDADYSVPTPPTINSGTQ